MSMVVKCDGCGINSRDKSRPADWLKVHVYKNGGVKVAVGDFHDADCLARYLASDKLDRAIKLGEASA